MNRTKIQKIDLKKNSIKMLWSWNEDVYFNGNHKVLE